ncbi:MAG: oxaloacetate decarboxylase [Ruminococcus sp.]|nr:oxaloacetate decarboxylase [Ruminococcus sp.]
MKKGLVIAGAALFGGGALGLAAFAAYLVLSASRQVESVGIIGGADAPTAIFLAGRLGLPFIVVILPLLACAVVGAALLVTALIIHLKKKDPEG